MKSSILRIIFLGNHIRGEKDFWNKNVGFENYPLHVGSIMIYITYKTNKN